MRVSYLLAKFLKLALLDLKKVPMRQADEVSLTCAIVKESIDIEEYRKNFKGVNP